MAELDAVASPLYAPLYARPHASQLVPRAGFRAPVAAGHRALLISASEGGQCGWERNYSA